MTANMKPPALKHGAFSKIKFLPGEDPQEFENLKAHLFAEYSASGRSEEETLESIAEVMWKAKRLGLYQHIEYLRARRSGRTGYRGPTGLDPMARALANCASAGRTGMAPDPEEVEQILRDQAAAAEKNMNDEDRLLEFGDLLTLEQLNKEIDVQNKLQCMLDRLFKRLWQIKGMKPLVTTKQAPQSAYSAEAPLLELNASDVPKVSDLNCDAAQFESVGSDSENR